MVRHRRSPSFFARRSATGKKKEVKKRSVAVARPARAARQDFFKKGGVLGDVHKSLKRSRLNSENLDRSKRGDGSEKKFKGVGF